MTRRKNKVEALTPNQLMELISRRLRPIEKLGFLEQYAMFMVKAQLIELSLKSLLRKNFKIEESRIDDITLGAVIKMLIRKGIRRDFVNLLGQLNEYRIDMAHSFLAIDAFGKSVIGAKQQHLSQGTLTRALIKVEEVTQVYIFLDKNNALITGTASMPEPLNALKQTTARFYFPVCKKPYSGWKDYDRGVLEDGLVLEDKIDYLKNRLDMIFFKSMDQVYLNSATHSRIVNSSDMSFFFIGTTVICCCIEALGGFILGRDRDSGKSFYAFIEKYMPGWCGTVNGVSVKKWLWDNLRNGLAHNLIIREGGLEDLKELRYRHVGDSKLEVHAEILYKELKRGAENYFHDLRSKSDPVLVENYERLFKQAYQTF